MFAERGNRVGGLGAWVRMCPVIGRNDLCRVRGILEHVVLRICLARDDVRDFRMDAAHGFNEAIELGFGFGFGGFNHESPWDRERHGGCMEPEVHEAFGNVIDRGVGDVVDGARIKDTLVSDESLSARVEDGVEVAEFFSDVVGIEDSDRRGFFETGFAHGCQVHPADGRNGSTSPRRSGDSALFATAVEVTREVVCQLGTTTDAPDARTAPAMRHGKGFVEVEVADISANGAWARPTDLSVHVSAIHVNETAVFVDELAELCNGGFIDAVSGRIGDHDAGEIIVVSLDLSAEVIDIDVAVVITADRDNRETCHGGGGRVGAVS